MQTEIEPYSIIWKNWTVRLRHPKDPTRASKVVLLLHGWTGDEFSMWIFTNQLPDNILLLAPRAPFKTDTTGFGWTETHHEGFATASDFSMVSDALIDRIQALISSLNLPTLPINLIGFSQGAALSYYLAASYPDQIGKVACLAGFLPNGIEPIIENGLLAEKEFFIAHGTQDETVPVSYAREAAQKLQDGNARLIYCEDNTGHKLGASCFRGLNAFIKSIPEYDYRP
ncbi:MAG: alpha/beta fold hydrolase [Anaerolineaceae bacterium]|nr:alpha/beta fold hydrolase [Anaerolineaceae bacterium]